MLCCQLHDTFAKWVACNAVASDCDQEQFDVLFAAAAACARDVLTMM